LESPDILFLDEPTNFIDMNKYMNKNGEEKSLTIRYQIYLDKLSNYNYYDKESADNSEFFATLMDIGVKKGKSAEIENLDFKFFVSDGKLASTQTRARSAEFRSKVIDADAKKQERKRGGGSQ